MTFPNGSYIIDYLNAIEEYPSTGPPTYVVIQDGYDYNDAFSRSLLSNSNANSTYSLLSELNGFVKSQKIHFYKHYPFWMDGYQTWVTTKECCSSVDTSGTCWKEGSDKFTDRIDEYVEFSADLEGCSIEGRGYHKPSIELRDKNVGATNIMIGTLLPRTDSDFIHLLKAARNFSDSVSQKLVDAKAISRPKNGLNPVFVYNVLFPFYEQYISLQRRTILNFTISIWVVSITTFLLLGMDFHSSVIILLTLVMTMVDMFGIMFLAGVHLNAISVVNLVMAVGIAVEFYAHIVRDYAITHIEDKTERTTKVLSNIGASVFVGVTIPELMSVAMLSKASSKIFQVYFFRMYLSLILICTLKAFVFLPVMLSYLGKPFKPDKSENVAELNAR
ncbi:hypothetical protein ACOME3_003902 [Neoechinorhynchus agilis]